VCTTQAVEQEVHISEMFQLLVVMVVVVQGITVLLWVEIMELLLVLLIPVVEVVPAKRVVQES
jgi:hypothetical protein